MISRGRLPVTRPAEHAPRRADLEYRCRLSVARGQPVPSICLRNPGGRRGRPGSESLPAKPAKFASGRVRVTGTLTGKPASECEARLGVATGSDGTATVTTLRSFRADLALSIPGHAPVGWFDLQRIFFLSKRPRKDRRVAVFGLTLTAILVGVVYKQGHRIRSSSPGFFEDPLLLSGFSPCRVASPFQSRACHTATAPSSKPSASRIAHCSLSSTIASLV